MYDRFRLELLLMGKKILLPPLVLLVGGSLLAVFLSSTNGPTARFLSAVLEMLLPLATGTVVAFLVAFDPMLELHLTFPLKYHITVLQRLVVVILWSSCLACIASCIIVVLKLAFLPQPYPASPMGILLAEQLAWFPSLLGCTALGFAAALVLQSRTASIGLLAGIWLVEIVFKNILIQITWLFPFLLFPTTLFPDGLDVHQWQLNRFLVLVVALLLLLASSPLLLLPERLLKGAHQA